MSAKYTPISTVSGGRKNLKMCVVDVFTPQLEKIWWQSSGPWVKKGVHISLKMQSADEEPVDPKKLLEESCKPKCVRPLLEYQACIKRIQGDDSGQKHCTGQYFDYWYCVDKCVAPKLFTKLK
ncbi:cytochrome B-c1 complex subunit 6 [Medicago truncatula]|uniref:Complex III subunit VI n=1 Tax=Medicago truncatula TaxID=3880 RepID=G7IL87_MEDTR|nr:cytochrome B-c1 complex subunit 6 [Medicago truncatula]